MNPLIEGNLKSKTSWAAILLMALGALEQSGLLALVPDEYKGIAISAIGALMLFLRNVTDRSIVSKAVSQPGGNRQGGVARPLALVLLTALAVLTLGLQGCATNSDGSQSLTPEGQAILETSTRIAVRHYVADSPRAAERVANLREVVGKLQQLTSAETTLGALKAVVVLEVERLNLEPVDREDALDLLDLFAAALEARLGQEPLQATGLVRVQEFLSLVLGAIPVQPAA